MARGMCLCLLLFHLRTIVAIPLSRYSISEQPAQKEQHSVLATPLCPYMDFGQMSRFELCIVQSWVCYQLSHPYLSYNLCSSGPALYTVLVIYTNSEESIGLSWLISERSLQKPDKKMHTFKATTKFCAVC